MRIFLLRWGRKGEVVLVRYYLAILVGFVRAEEFWLGGLSMGQKCFGRSVVESSVGTGRGSFGHGRAELECF